MQDFISQGHFRQRKHVMKTQKLGKLWRIWRVKYEEGGDKGQTGSLDLNTVTLSVMPRS